jgi:hypothetical protein
VCLSARRRSEADERLPLRDPGSGQGEAVPRTSIDAAAEVEPDAVVVTHEGDPPVTESDEVPRGRLTARHVVDEHVGNPHDPPIEEDHRDLGFAETIGHVGLHGE